MATREYEFICDKCQYEFSKYYDWNKIEKPFCPMCDSDDTYRNFGAEKVIVDDGCPRTLGALADRNSKAKGIKIDGKSKRI